MPQVPRVFARDEEGFGLRPNLGIRGLTHSLVASCLMLEDGSRRLRGIRRQRELLPSAGQNPLRGIEC